MIESYGLRPFCVRYPHNEQVGKRFKTVELIIEELPYSPTQAKLNPEPIIGICISPCIR